MNKSMMAVGAHADDVELHFGGTLFKYLDKGYKVVYVMATNNMSGSKRWEGPDGKMTGESFGTLETMEYRKREAEEAAKLFATTPIHLDHPQRHYSTGGKKGESRSIEVRYGCPLPEGVPPDVPTILTAGQHKPSVRRLADLIMEHDPEVVFTHSCAETNPEHYGTSLLVANAYWEATEDGYKGSLLNGVRQFPAWGVVGHCWQTWTDITGYVDRRMEAVRKHVSQYPPDWEHGAVHWRRIAESHGKVCGVKAAEIFNFVNSVEPSEGDGELLSELLRNRATGKWWG